jgi:hypothetical protein
MKVARRVPKQAMHPLARQSITISTHASSAAYAVSHPQAPEDPPRHNPSREVALRAEKKKKRNREPTLIACRSCALSVSTSGCPACPACLRIRTRTRTMTTPCAKHSHSYSHRLLHWAHR